LAVSLALTLASGAGGAMGQTQPAEEMTPREKAIRYAQLYQQMVLAFRDATYAEAEKQLQEMLTLEANSADTYYNIACARARLGKTEQAFADLRHSVELGWDDADHAREDPDLEKFRTEKRFTDLLAKMAEAIGPVRKVEGGQVLYEGKAGGGFRYRLRMAGGSAAAGARQRLIVWLHPSGGSMNNVAESLAPMLHRHGWALVVFEGKSFAGWQGADEARLRKTLAAVGKIEGMDAARPLLLGYSAGGQMALMLWADNPAAWGGLILDAAYPITGQSVNGEAVPLAIPKDAAAVRRVPVFVLVGGEDGGSQLWRQVSAAWKLYGVPLVVYYVEGGRHAWLFGAQQQKDLETWLTDLPKVWAGDTPAAAAATSGPTTKAGSPATGAATK
jgi:predicted esterase